MKKTIFYFFAFLLFLRSGLLLAGVTRFSDSLCEDDRFQCREIQEGDSWTSIWEDAEYRDQIKRLNRMNIKLRPGMKIAVPVDPQFFKNNQNLPFPAKVDAPLEKQVRVNLSILAWGAYDEEGNLLKWGPASGGKGWCPDVGTKCVTPAGEYSVLNKQGAQCISHKFPIPRGGAPMPYCMFFRRGYALHGSPEVPGYNASHGCVRLFTEDAKWLNEEFMKGFEGQGNDNHVKVLIER